MLSFFMIKSTMAIKFKVCGKNDEARRRRRHMKNMSSLPSCFKMLYFLKDASAFFLYGHRLTFFGEIL